MNASANALPVRPDWLATHDEPAREPGVPVIDTHHHLYHRPDIRYLLDDYLADIETGHRLLASVFVQARSMLTEGVPPELAPVGEVEFANGVAAMSASGFYGPARLCAAITGFADLTLGAAVRPVLERLVGAGGGRLRGIRQALCWDADSALLNPSYPTNPRLSRDPVFREGFAQLAPLGLHFESWAFFHQMHDIADLARAFPGTQIVVNHCGGVLRVRGYADRRDLHDLWAAGVADLASCPNVVMKLSGLGMKMSGFKFEDAARAPDSETLASTWRPWIEPCLEAFGAERCMYGSNFPVDKGSYAFKVGINALKALTAGASRAEKDAIFWETATRVYRLPEAIRAAGRGG